MADISMCAGVGCSRKATCYRHIAPPSSHWQAYFAPLKPDGSCDYYWPDDEAAERAASDVDAEEAYREMAANPDRVIDTDLF